MSNHLGLFYAYGFGYPVHGKFILIFFSNYLFSAFFLHTVVLNANDF